MTGLGHAPMIYGGTENLETWIQHIGAPVTVQGIHFLSKVEGTESGVQGKVGHRKVPSISRFQLVKEVVCYWEKLLNHTSLFTLVIYVYTWPLSLGSVEALVCKNREEEQF